MKNLYKKFSAILAAVFYLLLVSQNTYASIEEGKEQEVIFVFNSVKEYQTLVTGLKPGTSVRIVDANKNGINQISEFLSNRNNLKAIHLFSHGKPGELNLGTILLNNDNIKEYSDQLSVIGNALSEEGDILIYGCNVAKGNTGEEFITNLSKATKADVAASNDLTGNIDLGGDWELEVQTGLLNNEEYLSDKIKESYKWVLQTTGTTDGTYDFGTLGALNTGGTGYKTCADKFVVSNAFNGDGSVLWLTSTASATVEFIAEGGSTMKQATVGDMEIGLYSGETHLTQFDITLKNASGTTIATHTFSGDLLIDTNDGNISISTLSFSSAWPSGGYDNVASISITYTQDRVSSNFEFRTITLSNISTVVGSNNEPTASSFTASPVYENTTYAFSTANFSYLDDDGDPLDHIRVTAVPANGSLWVDSDGSGTINGAESALSNSGTVSKANLDAGYLKYLNTNGTSSSFTFDVSDGTDYSSSTYTATLTVTPEPTVTLSLAPSSTISENGGSTSVKATLSNTFNKTVTINLGFSGTASGTDYSKTGSSINITSGNSTGTITLSGDDDNLDENNETVIVDISTITNGAESGTQQVTCTITDDDNTPVVTASQSFSVDEDAANTTSVGTVAATDADAGTTFQSWSITGGNGDGIFAINSATGEITVTDNTNLDYETKTSYSLTVTVSDGTNTSAGETVTINVNDVTPPVSPVVTSPSGSVIVNSASQTLSGTHTENGVTVHAYADNNNDGVADNTTPLGSSTVSGNSWSFSVNLTSDAANNFVVQAEDGAGNVSSDVDVPTITEDSTDPVSPIVTSPSGSITVNSATQTLSGTHTENGVTVHAYADNNNDGVADNTTSLGSSTVSGNSWSFSVSLTSDAANNFVVQAEDLADNVSSDVDVPTITEDSSSPTLNSSNPADDATAIVVGNNLTLTFNEAITFGSGTIEIIDLDNGSSTVTIDVTSPGTQASISGDVLTLNPSSGLEYSTNYAVQIEATAIEDLYSNVYSGIVDNTTLNFYTEDPVIAFSTTSSSGAESVSSADLTVEISAVSPRDVTVNYTVGGTATGGGTDYTLVDGTLTITAGNLNNVISIANIVNDLLVEANETVFVSIASPSNASLGANTAHTYTILDDDQATVTIADVSGNEDDGAITITATLDNPVDGGFSVDVSTSDGTATAGVDYFAVSSQTLTFTGTANETKTFTVTPKVDSNPEPNETVNVSMSNIGATGIAASKFDITDVAVLTIIDDDVSQISVSDQNLAEAPTNMTFTVFLDKSGIAPITVDYATSDGTAEAGSDYTSVSGTLTFASGETSKSVIVPISGDNILEADESFTVTLSNVTGTANLLDGSGTGVIENDDAASVTIADVATDEDNGTVTVTLSLDNGVQGGFTVNASTTDGTATTTDSDYTAISGEVLTFAGTAGETQVFDITLGVDAKLEANETLTVAMSTLAATTLGVDITDQATVTITNDDDASVTIADVSGNEDDGAITVTAVLDNPVDGGFSVDVSTSDGTATAGVDYFAVSSQTLTFAGTANETKAFTVTPKVDSNPESNETVNITVGNLAATSLAVDITDVAVLTIIDDDVSQISVSDQNLAEASTNMTFTVFLDKSGIAPITVDYATSDGTAEAGSDYTSVSGTLTFASGETSKSVIVPISGDNILEADESFTVTLSNVTGTANLLDGSGTGVIENDDAASVTIADVATNEDNGTVTVTLSLDNGVQGGFIVNASTTDGTATTTDSDYTAISGEVLTFAGTAGETQVFDITLGVDTKLEANETLTVAMSTLAATTLGVDITDQATVTITNDDDASVTIADVSGNEDDGAITVTAVLDNPVDGGFSVDVSTSDGTATAGVDYFAISSQTLTFAGTANETKTFTVTPKVDSNPEPNETVNISMSNIGATGLAASKFDITDVGILTIKDDDASQISISDQNLAETSTNMIFTVSLDKSGIAPITVDYATSDGTAEAGSDYTSVSGTLTFASGETSKSVIVPISGDNILEADESFTVTLSNVTGTANLLDGSGTGVIENDDAASVTIADVAANEDNGTVTVTLSLENGVQGGFTVNASTTDATATTTDSDYTAISGEVLTFAGTAGETQTFDITLGVDTKLEANETLTVAMSTLAATTLGVDITDQATVTITNDDDASVTIADVSGNEDDGAITITATLDNPVDGGFSVDVSTSDGTATAGVDYFAVSSQTLIFAGTANETKTFTVTPKVDSNPESNETVNITVGNLAATSLAVDITDVAVLTIIDDDASSISIDNPTIAEGSSGNTDLTFTVSLDKPQIAAVTVDYAVTGGTATSGDDYTILADGTLTFAAGETSKTVVISVIGDTNVETNETIELTLTNATGAALIADASGTATITNDDSAAVTIADISANEDAGTVTVTASLNNGVQGGFTVNASTTDGTATTTDSDYTAISGEVLTFAGTAGETQTFDITLGSDTKLEANETLTVAISTLAATTLGIDITDQATVTITNDDNASLTIANVSGNEDDGAITVTAVLDNPVAGGFSVNYASADGTATSSDDYTSVSGTLTFAGTLGESQEFTIVPTADLIDEGDETISISLASLSGTVLPVSISDEATITILDDDNTPRITTGQSFNIDETIANGHEVGTILATDADAGTTFSNWTITEGNGDGIFAINSSTGEITVTDNTNLDYETKTSYSLTVTVSDGTNISAGETVTVNVNNINDNTPVITASQSFNVSEDAANTTSLGTVAATDADAGTTLSDWTITEGNGDGIFAINSSTGEITVTDNTKLDYETRTSYYLTVTVSDGSHTSSSETISITVNDVFEKSDQNITFSQLADLTYGDSDFNLTATASSGLPVSYSSSNTSVATINGNTVTIMGTGSTTITASQNGNASYNAATDVQQVLIVRPRALTIMADDKTKIYDGMVYSPFTVSYAGFVTGEDDTDLRGALTFSGTATTATDVSSDYVITPGGLISDNYAITFVDGTLSITKAAQIITFNEIPLKHLETDPDFNLNATSSSGLAVTYNYSHSSTTAPAEVSPTGFVSLLASGEVEITVSQEGDNNYLPAEPVTRTMTIESSDASIHSITINGVTYDSPDQEIYYLIDCNDEQDKVEIGFSTEANATGNTGSNFEIETPTPGIYRKEIQVTSQDGTNTRIYRVVVEKRFNYEDIVIQKYNNVLLVNNNPETNGGYRFTSFNWYKDGVLIGTGQYYSVGDNASDQLDLNAMYSVEMETEDGDILSTCESSITLKSAFVLKVAPNPVHSGSTIDVTTTYSAEMLTDLKITVSNLYGLKVMQEVSGSNNSRITLPSSLTPGTYVISTKAGGIELSTKIIVQ